MIKRYIVNITTVSTEYFHSKTLRHRKLGHKKLSHFSDIQNDALMHRECLTLALVKSDISDGLILG